MAILRSERGQIVIPFVFVPLSLFLFVFLIFETAKISREKIRHQFAVDSAAFVEMTNYSDFLNRSAYVNGAFPQRIFEEGFKNTMIERKDNTVPDSLYDILYKNGAFPRTSLPTPLDPYPTWDIRFGGTGVPKNGSPPDMGSGLLELITLADALDYWLSWQDARDIYTLYVQIYTLLGSVEDAQYSVFCRLTGARGCPGGGAGGHNFFRKSFWLNTGSRDAEAAGREGASGFDNYGFAPKPYCIQEIMFYGNQPTSDPFQPYKQVAPQTPISMSPTIQGCQPSSGLFQAMWISQGQLASMARVNEVWPGYPITQSWRAPGNFFNVDFNRVVRGCPRSRSGGIGPCVHATISLSGGKLWPDPTPKFQTRLYP